MTAGFPIVFGLWLGLLNLNGAELPFHFELEERSGKPVMVIHNAEERILCDEIALSRDSMFIRMPLYDSELRLRIGSDTLSGIWINRGRKTPATLPFVGLRNRPDRFQTTMNDTRPTDISGKWETWFDAGSTDSSLAIGIFRRMETDVVYGTFMTETGDHRFLEGRLINDSLKLSVFDGSHAWLYLGRIDGDRMNGMFYSGNHYKAPFMAKRNPEIRLRDASGITTMNGPVSFTLPDCDSVLHSTGDDRYRNRVVIYQVMGTWCPNCMDESVFLDSIYRQRATEGLEVVGLAFERSSEFAKSVPGIRRTVNRLSISYPVVYAGSTDRERIKAVFPAMSGFASFPTTIIADRKGQVVKVHSGFSGPATGEAWELYKRDFSRMLDRLLR